MTRTIDPARRAAAHRGRERRYFAPRCELRDASTADGAPSLHLTGFACVTDVPYTVSDWFGDYTEVVRPGAFTKTRAESDVVLLVNHEGIPMARTGSNTMRLDEVLVGDPTGLAVDADLEPRSNLTNDVALAMGRGDLDKMSFAFQVTKQAWSPDGMQRDIQEVRLFDVSVVTFPANGATSAQLDARQARITQRLAERRALDPEDVAMLTQSLGWLSAVDSIVDQGQDVLADYLGIPSPDDDDTLPDPGETDPLDPAMMGGAARALAMKLRARLIPARDSGTLSLYTAQADSLRLVRH